ncbi:MAG: hypothetical protein QW241_09115 [Candidatus Bathyarchaeia archaeon]
MTVRVDKRFLIRHLRCFGNFDCSINGKCPVTYECWRELLRRLRK